MACNLNIGNPYNLSEVIVLRPSVTDCFSFQGYLGTEFFGVV